MSRRNDTSKVKAQDSVKAHPSKFNNAAENRRSAEAEIPQGPSKDQDKRSNG